MFVNGLIMTTRFQIECLISKVQSSKTVIAQAHSDLSRANAQVIFFSFFTAVGVTVIFSYLKVSKYQAALSSCYILNGDLMTKVSGS